MLAALGTGVAENNFVLLCPAGGAHAATTWAGSHEATLPTTCPHTPPTPSLAPHPQPPCSLPPQNEGDDEATRARLAEIRVGSYIRAHGHFQSFNQEKAMVAFNIRPVIDFNEVGGGAGAGPRWTGAKQVDRFLFGIL